MVRGEVRDQLRQMGVATEEEVNALRKRVRDLERTARATGAAWRQEDRPRSQRRPRRPPRASRRAPSRRPEKTDTAAGVTRRRLDAELVRRGLDGNAERRRARRWRPGSCRSPGVVASKPATMVADDAAIALLGASRPFVSRAGSKLAAALDRFAIDPPGCRCLDAGASTGGFTDVLLQRGAGRRRGGRRRATASWRGSSHRSSCDGARAHERPRPHSGRSAGARRSRGGGPLVHLAARGAARRSSDSPRPRRRSWSW